MSRVNVTFINIGECYIDLSSCSPQFVNEKTNKYESAQLCTYLVDAVNLSFFLSFYWATALYQ